MLINFLTLQYLNYETAVELSNGGTELLKVTINFGYDNWKEMGLIDGFMDLVGKGGDLLKNTAGQIGSLF